MYNLLFTISHANLLLHTQSSFTLFYCFRGMALERWSNEKTTNFTQERPNETSQKVIKDI